MSKTFAEATAITQLSSHTYSADFPDDWCIGSVPHGGFVTAMFLTVAQDHFKSTLCSQNQPHSIALHLDFLRRTQGGAALFTVRDVKLGRQTSVIHITLSQGSLSNPREEVVGYITNSNFATEEGVTFSTHYQLTPPPPKVDLALLKHDKDKNWARQGDMPFARFRKATTKTQFHFPRRGQPHKNIADEWIRLANGENWTNASLGYVCDMWPMPVEAFLYSENPYDIKSREGSLRPARFWYPTVLLNLEIKKSLSKKGVEWLFARVITKSIKNGRMDLEIVILDEGGEIVALSNHVALAVAADRNLAERRKGEEKKRELSKM